MKFKVGDKVKCIGGGSVGVVECVREDRRYPFIIMKGSGERGVYEGGELELVKPEEQEPVPGGLYRTSCGDKVLYVGKDKRGSFIYQEVDGSFTPYDLPFYFFESKEECTGNIVGEWVDEVILPEVSITRWAVVSRRDNFVVKYYTSHVEAEGGLAALRGAYEIVELTGTLPSRLSPSSHP